MCIIQLNFWYMFDIKKENAHFKTLNLYMVLS